MQNVGRLALLFAECLVDDIYGLEEESAYPKMEALLRTAEEFVAYIQRNADTIPSYGERYRNHERIATSFVESAVN